MKKYQPQLRAIYQIAASPNYGPQIREFTEEAANANAEGIQKLSVILNCDAGLLTPLVYNLIAIILGYALWDSRDIAEVQLRDLHRMMKDRLWPEDETNLIYRKEENEK